jgi:HlyD family secretion protein
VVRRGELLTTVLLTGGARAAHHDLLTVPRTAARAVQIRWIAPDGGEVQAGDKVIELDNSAIVSTIEDLRASVDGLRNEVERQKAANLVALAERRFEVDRQRVEVEKAGIWADLPSEVLPRREWRERQLGMDRARVALARAEDELEAAGRGCAADLRVAQIDLDKVQRELQTAEESLGLLTFTAPRSGPFLITGQRWGGRHVGVGDTVWPGWTIGEIADTSEMRVEAWLLDADDGRVREGAPAVCVCDAYPGEPRVGRVLTVAPAARELGERGARRAFQVVVALDGGTGKRVTPGMSVRVEVESGRYPDVLLVPRAALDLAATPPRATLEGGSLRQVTIGACGPQECIVEAGLTEGQRLQSYRGSGA